MHFRVHIAQGLPTHSWSKITWREITSVFLRSTPEILLNFCVSLRNHPPLRMRRVPFILKIINNQSSVHFRIIILSPRKHKGETKMGDMFLTVKVQSLVIGPNISTWNKQTKKQHITAAWMLRPGSGKPSRETDTLKSHGSPVCTGDDTAVLFICQGTSAPSHLLCVQGGRWCFTAPKFRSLPTLSSN